MPEYPLITIIIATFNSTSTLSRVLESIKKQSYPKERTEILIIDGGSQDETVKIAKNYGCQVINNPRTEPVYAKHLGYLRAKGKYIVYLDHDEVIQNQDSLSLKVKIFQKNDRIKAVVGSGYQSPPCYSFINNYINEFGDPFSFFIYRLSKDFRYFIRYMRRKYQVVQEDKDCLIVDLSKAKNLPIIELAALASMTDSQCLRNNFPETLKRPDLLPHFFYLIHSRYPLLGVAKKDVLIHYSSDSLKKYLKKIKWRVKNNIHFSADMGAAGFSGREKIVMSQRRLSKYLFIPYSMLFVPVLIDSIFLAVNRRNLKYLIHLPLCLYTSGLIVFHYILKTVGLKPKLKSYDESKVIDS